MSYAGSSGSKVNEVIGRAQGERPAPRDTGTIHYATQVTTGPPAFVLFGGRALNVPAYLKIWRTLPADSTVEEVNRNYFIRQPVIWTQP